ncbi:MAG: hypothetical protein GY820_09540, partial [Gammaproteobacteria bacterium]|nr:hypothetical protein [Gammaproteobacteria bacterium]
IYARGGAQGGDGGFIETSGKKGFELPVAPDVSAVAGEGGLWLIDPYNITISDGDGSSDSNIDTSGTPYFSDGNPAVLETQTILDGLSGGDVTIVTGGALGDGNGDGDIIFDAALNYNSTGSNTFTLNALDGILFTATSSISGGNNPDDVLNINLYSNGAVNIASGAAIETNGGNLTVGDANGIENTPTSFTNNGTIDTSGIDSTDDRVRGSNAGDISLTVNGAVNSTGLTANGGLNVGSDSNGDALAGADGGSITIDADSVALTGAITSSGSAARFDDNDNNGGADGGSAGSISLTATTGDISVSGGLEAIGGAAAGNNNDSGNGGNGGSIYLSSQTGSGTVFLSGAIDVSGKTGFGNNSDGSNGDVEIVGTLDVSNALDIVANTFTSGNIDASGANDSAGHDITITADTAITTGDINTTGGTVTAATSPGQNGGDVILSTADITVSAITTTGSDATAAILSSANGGDGGAVTITATDNGGTPSITLNGDIVTAAGSGAGIGGSSGSDGNKSLTLNGTDAGNTDGTLTIGSGVTFSAAVEVTSNTDGSDTVTVTDGSNTWAITGENTGTLNSSLTFVDFENLSGGSGDDTFNLVSGGSLTGLAKGGAGKDVANITLTGAETGSFSFDGKSSQDTINLIGGSSSYQGQYNSDVGGFEQLEYTAGGNAYTVNYTNTETVNDNLTAAELTINGTSANDSISLGSDSFVVNAATTVGYSNKTNLTIDGLNGTDTVTGVGASTISAGVLTISNVATVGSAGNAMRTSIDQVELVGVTGDVFIDELDQIDLGVSTVSGSLSMVSGGNITQSGALRVDGATILNATGNDITLDNAGNAFNSVNIIDAQNVTLTETNDIALQSTRIAGDLIVTAGGDIINSGALRVAGATTLTATGNDITLDNANNDFTSVALSGANVSIQDTNAIEFAASTITGGFTVDTNGGGNITQSGALSV